MGGGGECEFVSLEAFLLPCSQHLPAPCHFLNVFRTSPLCILFLITQLNAPVEKALQKLNTYESNTLLKHLGQPKRSDDAAL